MSIQPATDTPRTSAPPGLLEHASRVRRRRTYYNILWNIENGSSVASDHLPFNNPALDLLARCYHEVSSPWRFRKLRAHLLRRAGSLTGRVCPPRVARHRNISEIAGSAIPRTLVFIARPGDEASCSGLLCELSSRGAPIALCCLTMDEGAFAPRFPRDEVAALREEELREALRHIGIREVRFLDYIDRAPGAYRDYAPRLDRPELRRSIAALLDEFEPRLVITHGSCGETWHPANLLLHDEIRASLRARSRSTGVPPLLTINAWADDDLRDRRNIRDEANFTFDGSVFHANRLRSLLEHKTRAPLFEKISGGSVEDFIQVTAVERYHLAT